MANNTLIGALRAEATLESGKFVDGAKKIRQESKATEAQVKQSFSGMGAAIKGFGGALTAGLSVGLLGAFAKKALDYATAIKDVAAQAGVTTKELQQFRYAAGQLGVAQADADKGLERLNVTMGKAAAGSATAQKALAAVGVTMQDVQTKSRTEIFGQIADQMAKQGGAAKNAAAANAIFGESAAKLNPLLDEGSAGINELAAAAQRLGVVLSDQQIQQADETAQKLDDVRRVLAAQIAGVVADNASSIVTLANALATLTSSIVNFLGSNPQLALAILGGLAGSRVGGLPGLAGGALAGAALGGNIAENRALESSRNDVGLLRHNTKQAADAIRAKRAAGQPIKQSELDRLQRLTAKLNSASGNAPSSFGSAPLPQFLASAPKGGGGRKRTPRAPRDRSDDVEYQFGRELRQAQMSTLRAHQSMATTNDERARLALAMLDLQKIDNEAELANRVRRAERDFAEGKITEGALEKVKLQADALRAEQATTDALERKAIAEELAADKARDAAQLVDSGYSLRLELLQTEAALADTAAERRDVELRILDVMKEQEKARLEALIADKDSSEAAKEEARRRLAALDAIYSGRADAVRAGTRNPIEEYKARYGDITEENQQAIVNGLEDMADALSRVTEGWDQFKEAALNALKSVVQTILRNQINQLFASLLPGGAGGFNFGSMFGGAPGAASSGNILVTGLPTTLPGFASGGSMRLGGIPGIDQNVLALNGLPIARVSQGERLDISNDNGSSGGGGDLNVNVTLPRGMSQREGRATGLSMGRGIKERMAYSVRGRR